MSFGAEIHSVPLMFCSIKFLPSLDVPVAHIASPLLGQTILHFLKIRILHQVFMFCRFLATC